MHSRLFCYLKVKVSVTQLCPTLCDPMDCSSPGSSVHGILQARILKWVAISLRDLPNPGIDPGSSALQADSLLSEAPGVPSVHRYSHLRAFVFDVFFPLEQSPPSFHIVYSLYCWGLCSDILSLKRALTNCLPFHYNLPLLQFSSYHWALPVCMSLHTLTHFSTLTFPPEFLLHEIRVLFYCLFCLQCSEQHPGHCKWPANIWE